MPGASKCRTRYFDEVLKVIPPGNVALLADVDTAMASWPNMNAALLDAESWVAGSKRECYPWPATDILAPFKDLLNEEVPLVFFNFAAPTCRGLGEDVDCTPTVVRDPRIVQVLTAQTLSLFRIGDDIAWPLRPNDAFLEATREYRGVTERPILGSFVGTATHSVRRRLRDAMAQDDDFFAVVRETNAPERDETAVLAGVRSLGCDRVKGDAGAVVMGCSKFVIAPRGHSVHSSRLLEAIAAGAVPVVVSDDWVLPFEHDLLDWTTMAIRIPEAHVGNITEILRAVDAQRWYAMVEAGKRAWTKLMTVAGSLDALATILETRRQKSESSSSLLPEGTKAVLLNVGSSLEPVLPAATADDVVAVAFEPLLHIAARIPEHPKLRVVPAAVSSFNGLRTMTVYNANGISSSLGPAAADSFWNTNASRGDGRLIVVPVLSLRTVLESFATVDIPYLKTDMQGADFAAIHSVVETDPAMLRRIPYLLTEVWLHNEQSYLGFDNDLCRNWLPLMDDVGYTLVYIRVIESNELKGWERDDLDAWSQQWAYNPHIQCAADLANVSHVRRGGLFEADVHWIRNDTFAAILSGNSDPKPQRPPVASDFDWPLFF